MSPESSQRPPALEMQRHRLENGLEVLLQRAPSTSTTFAVTWISEGGTALDPPGSEGIAMAASRLLTAGSRRHDKRSFARELDRLASTLSSRASWERLEVEASGPQDAQREVLALLREALTEPRFEAKEVERVRREMKEALWREATQPDERADRAFLERLLPSGHPYRRNPLGEPRTISRIDRERVRAFHERHLTPQGAKLVVTSHEPGDRVLRELQRTFGAWEGPAPTARPKLPAPRGPNGGRTLHYLAVHGSVQVEVIIGGKSPPREHPDFAALSLANEILGGRPVLSRLFQVVREQEGLAYGAGSELEALAWDGMWTADAGTDAGHVARVHELLLQEVKRLATEGPSSSELERIRESYLGSLPLLLETSPQAHGLAVEVAYFDLPLDHFETWPTTLRALSPKDLQRAVAEHLWTDAGPLGVAAGPASGDPARAHKGGSRRP